MENSRKNYTNKSFLRRGRLILTMFIALMTIFTACKKDKETEKEKTERLLVSGKWYFNGGTVADPCFNDAVYWEFKADRTFSDRLAGGDPGTYVVSEDGKTITLTYSNDEVYTATNVSVSNTSLSFKLHSEYTYNFGKTGGDCPMAM